MAEVIVSDNKKFRSGTVVWIALLMARVLLSFYALQRKLVRSDLCFHE